MTEIKRLPKHIGIIPDGNRRWAVARGMEKEKGYDYGIEPGFLLLQETLKLGIPEMTIYVFTKENTHRPKKQIAAFQNAFIKFIETIDNKNKDVSILLVGDTTSPFFPVELMKYTNPEQNRKDKIRLNFLVNYSWKWDLNMIPKNNLGRGLKKMDIINHIGSKDVSRVDLVIRWGERNRLSGFLPIQAAYADIFVVNELWPDFDIEQFYRALEWFEKQDVTLGG
jgi:undecaprenyl diphosphate synthase